MIADAKEERNSDEKEAGAFMKQGRERNLTSSPDEVRKTPRQLSYVTTYLKKEQAFLDFFERNVVVPRGINQLLKYRTLVPKSTDYCRQPL